MDRNKKSEYFRLPEAIWLVLVPVGMGMLSAAYLVPDKFPYGSLGPLGTLVKYFVEEQPTVLGGIFYLAWLLHIGQAVYCTSLCSAKNLTFTTSVKWVVCVFMYGMFSMRHLIKYDPKKH